MVCIFDEKCSFNFPIKTVFSRLYCNWVDQQYTSMLYTYIYNKQFSIN